MGRFKPREEGICREVRRAPGMKQNGAAAFRSQIMKSMLRGIEPITECGRVERMAANFKIAMKKQRHIAVEAGYQLGIGIDVYRLQRKLAGDEPGLQRGRHQITQMTAASPVERQDTFTHPKF